MTSRSSRIQNESSDEEPAGRKGRHVATPKGLGKRSSLFPAESSDEEEPANKKGRRIVTPKGLGKKSSLFPAESSDEEESDKEEPANKKGRLVATPKCLGKESTLFPAESSDEEEPAKKGRLIGSLFTSADRDLLIRIEKRLEQIECYLKKSGRKVRTNT